MENILVLYSNETSPSMQKKFRDFFKELLLNFSKICDNKDALLEIYFHDIGNLTKISKS